MSILSFVNGHFTGKRHWDLLEFCLGSYFVHDQEPRKMIQRYHKQTNKQTNKSPRKKDNRTNWMGRGWSSCSRLPAPCSAKTSHPASHPHNTVACNHTSPPRPPQRPQQSTRLRGRGRVDRAHPKMASLAIFGLARSTLLLVLAHTLRWRTRELRTRDRRNTPSTWIPSSYFCMP